MLDGWTEFNYGIKVNDAYFEYSASKFTVEENLLYTTIDLGDLFTAKSHAGVTFTVCGYIELDGTKYDSTLSKAFSVNTLIQYYIDNKTTLGLDDETVALLTSTKALLSA